MKKSISYIRAHKQAFIDELMELLKIPSVSADPQFADDVYRAADFLKNKFIALGLDQVEICKTAGYPVVYAEKIVDPTLPTILVYGHYDVQPADPYDLWDSPPFEPVVKNDRIYARGACDDKGQMYMHVKAFEAMTENGELACNVKFMIEGEEEVGSESLEQFLIDNAEKLRSDVIVISDTSMISNDHPSITVGLKGLSYLEVEVTGPNRDLHSGVYGGAVANPINTLCDMIASMIDENGRITIPGFYDDVVDLSDDDRSAMAKSPFDLETFKKELGIDKVKGEDGYTTLERTGIRPTLDVNGIWGGYIGEGAKTVLPSKAFAKISTRLVPNQNCDKILKLLTEHIEKIAPKSVKVKVTPHHGGNPVVTSTQSQGFKSASKAYEMVWGKTPIATRDGGSIPIVAMFDEILKSETVLMGMGLDEDAIHSPNESYGIINYMKGIETIAWFHHYFAMKGQNND